MLVPYNQQYCLSMYYYMYGEHVTLLSIYVRDAEGIARLAWQRVGQQGRLWHRAFLHLGTDMLQLLVEAQGSRGRKRLIAIDDLTVTNCSYFGKMLIFTALTVFCCRHFFVDTDK